MARALQEPLAKALGQSLIIDNRGGAAGTTGSIEAARADPDGYTLLFANNGPISIAPLLQKDIKFDPLKSYAPVSLVSKAPLLLFVNGKIPANSISELIKYSKAQTQQMLYASAGPGSLGHLSTERFLSQADLKMIHVPYKGQAPTSLAVFAGEVDMLLSTASDTMNEYVRLGKVKLLATSSDSASAVAPGSPQISDTLKGFTVNIWFGILAPVGTPAPVIEKLNKALKDVLANQQLKERFLTYGVEAAWGTPSDFEKIISAEIPEWRKVIEERKVKSD